MKIENWRLKIKNSLLRSMLFVSTKLMKNSKTKLVVGLGNPGEKYKKTRHNTGFIAVEAIALNFSAQGGAGSEQFSAWHLNTKFNAMVSEGVVGNKKIILAKPQTFMNESGKAVKAIAAYYKIPAENTTVIHDDLDIALGEYKIVKNRGSAGHKGVQSIIDNLGIKDFMRIRIGIGVENKKTSIEAFVLENFSKEEEKIITEVIEKVCKEIDKIL